MAQQDRFLVTGAFGCLGAWAVKQLVEAGVQVWTYDLASEPRRLRLIMPENQLALVNMLTGDITDQKTFEQSVVENDINHICHLAALQVPFVRANPVLGARVNVVGSTVVFETVRRHADQVQGLTYCSSVAVYPHPDRCPPGPLRGGVPLAPENLYGVFKQTNEKTAEVFWKEHEIPSIGVRPCVVYGPGRDQGWTSQPTKAMLAAAAGREFHMSFGGTNLYQYAADAAAAVIKAARSRPQGAPVFNMGGTSLSMREIVTAIEHRVPESAGRITFDDVQIAVPREIDGSELEECVGTCHWRPLRDGVRETIETFLAAISAGKLDVDEILAN